jgi:hypothetical protein
VLTCDIEGLKAVNHRYGHAAGDALIRAASNLLSSSVRDRDVVTRMGGDEFAVLLNGADLTVALGVRRRMRRAERRWRITEFGIRPRLSIGVAAVAGNDVEAAGPSPTRGCISTSGAGPGAWTAAWTAARSDSRSRVDAIALSAGVSVPDGARPRRPRDRRRPG